MLSRWALIFVWPGLFVTAGADALQVQGRYDVASAVQAALTHLSMNQADPTRQDLERFYRANGYTPVWTDGAGRPNGDALEALRVLREVADEGLDPFDYQSVDLEEITRLTQADSTAAERGSFDVRLSASLLRYLRHLHFGRVDPRTIGFSIVVPADHHDFSELLRAALARHQIADLAATLAPPFVQYHGLRAQLARYRGLAAQRRLQWLQLPTVGGRPGDELADVEPLREWLVALGDLPATSPLARDRYEGPVVDGVRRFQSRHGLAADGVIGTATLKALHVPLSQRVRQIELALERLRWLPDLNDTRFVAVNIPMFTLWAWDSERPGGMPAVGMHAIVGRAMSHKTPVFVADMRSIVFRPYWNVPLSIVRGEILPRLLREPDYLQRENIEIVSRAGESDASARPTQENIERLRQGRLLLRQRPGPANALGLIKFVFPNASDVYMHDTPAQELFSRTRRDFSHGCVRIEDPVTLAEWALQGQPEWTRERILSTMHGSTTLSVNLTEPVPVILFYVTAAFMPQDASIHFAEDIYAHDRVLDAALKKRHATAK